MSRKRTVNLVEEFALLSLDVNELHHVRAFGERTVTFPSIDFNHPWLSGLRTDRYSIQFQFHPRGEWHRVVLQWTRLYWGAWRPWFLCPYCRRRVGKLYNGGDFLACRTCCGLRYVSQTLGYHAKRHRQALKIRLRLGGNPSSAPPSQNAPTECLSKPMQKCERAQSSSSSPFVPVAIANTGHGVERSIQLSYGSRGFRKPIGRVPGRCCGSSRCATSSRPFRAVLRRKGLAIPDMPDALVGDGCVDDRIGDRLVPP
jgi:hypothetical protein